MPHGVAVWVPAPVQGPRAASAAGCQPMVQGACAARVVAFTVVNTPSYTDCKSSRRKASMLAAVLCHVMWRSPSGARPRVPFWSSFYTYRSHILPFLPGVWYASAIAMSRRNQEGDTAMAQVIHAPQLSLAKGAENANREIAGKVIALPQTWKAREEQEVATLALFLFS
jgi:hypothetical protein